MPFTPNLFCLTIVSTGAFKRDDNYDDNDDDSESDDENDDDDDNDSESDDDVDANDDNGDEYDNCTPWTQNFLASMSSSTNEKRNNEATNVEMTTKNFLSVSDVDNK